MKTAIIIAPDGSVFPATENYGQSMLTRETKEELVAAVKLLAGEKLQIVNIRSKELDSTSNS